MTKVEINTMGLARLQGLLEAECEAVVTESTSFVWSNARQFVAVDQGDLQASIVEGGAGLEQTVEAGSGLNYAHAQEFGRADIPVYRYTPFIKPAVEIERPNFIERLKQAIRRAGG